MIDYKKYSNMNSRQLFNYLSNAKKKEQKIKDDLNAQTELVEFLESKFKESIDEEKYEFVTRAEFALDKITKDIKKQFSKEEILEVEKEVEYLTNKDYDDEL